MEIIVYITIAVVAAVVSHYFTVWLNTPPPTTTTVSTSKPKKIVVRLGQPMAQTNTVVRAQWLVTTVRTVVSQHHPGVIIDVITSGEQSEVVVVDGDISPKDATMLAAWIHTIVYPR